MNPSIIIDRLGGTSETARLCEVKPPSVSEWRKTGIPKAQLKFLKLARPDVFEDLPHEPPPPEPDRSRRKLPDGKNVMQLGTEQPATFAVKKKPPQP